MWHTACLVFNSTIVNKVHVLFTCTTVSWVTDLMALSWTFRGRLGPDFPRPCSCLPWFRCWFSFVMTSTLWSSLRFQFISLYVLLSWSTRLVRELRGPIIFGLGLGTAAFLLAILASISVVVSRHLLVLSSFVCCRSFYLMTSASSICFRWLAPNYQCLWSGLSWSWLFFFFFFFVFFFFFCFFFFFFFFFLRSGLRSPLSYLPCLIIVFLIIQ